MRLVRPLLAAAALVAVPCIPSIAHAQEEPITANETRDRTVGGHTFIPTQLIGTPFNVTSFGSLTGFGYARATVTDSNGMPFTANFAALSQGFDASIKITDYVSIRLGASGSVFSGVDLASALFPGGRVNAEADAGVSFSLPFANRLRMGFAFDASYAPAYRVIPLIPLAATVAQQRLTSSGLLVNEQALQLGGAWQMALALHRSLGVFGEMRYTQAFASFNGDPSSYAFFSSGAGISFDLHAVTPIPFGILGVWRATIPVGGGDITHDFSAGFFYTGRRHLVLGPEASLTAPGTAGGLSKQLVAQGALILRYYW